MRSGCGLVQAGEPVGIRPDDILSVASSTDSFAARNATSHSWVLLNEPCPAPERLAHSDLCSPDAEVIAAKESYEN